MLRTPSGSSRDPREPFAEQRAVPRYTVAAFAEVIETATDMCIRGRISEISSKGCYITSPTTLPVGTLLELCVYHDRGTFTTTAKILYVQEGVGMGVVFLDLPQGRPPVLDSWLAELSTV
jgi:hypothetical protein